jgi:hypothetical protein
MTECAVETTDASYFFQVYAFRLASYTAALTAAAPMGKLELTHVIRDRIIIMCLWQEITSMLSEIMLHVKLMH